MWGHQIDAEIPELWHTEPFTERACKLCRLTRRCSLKDSHAPHGKLLWFFCAIFSPSRCCSFTQRCQASSADSQGGGGGGTQDAVLFQTRAKVTSDCISSGNTKFSTAASLVSRKFLYSLLPVLPVDTLTHTPSHTHTHRHTHTTKNNHWPSSPPLHH